ncbi:MAG: FixH family protein [Kiritimatiellia bacterium]
MSRSRFNPWPWTILTWFLVMIAVCVGFVIKSLGMKHDLVTPEYYAEGLDHDRRQTALSRTKALETPPRIELDFKEHRMIVRLPDFAKGAVLSMYRPSDARLDLKYALQDGVPSVLSTLDLHTGKWQAKISWETNGVPYYYQEEVFIQ